MAKTKKPDGGKTIIDVAHPGKSAPSANSKSVILSNRPLLKDPMMVDEAGPRDKDPDSSLAKVSNKSDVHPLTAPLLKPEEPAAADISPEADKPAETTPAVSGKPADEAEPADTKPAAAEPSKLTDSISPEQPQPPEDEPEPAQPAESTETPAAAETAHDIITDSVPDQASADSEAGKPKTNQSQPEKTEKSDSPGQPAADGPEPKPAEGGAEDPVPQLSDKDKKAEAENNKEAQRQAAIDKLTDSKKYYLPINAVEKRRSRRFVIVGILLSVLLILAWADIALDSGLIHINGIKPLTHFFSN